MNDADTRAYWWPYLAILLATVVLGAVFYDLDAFEALHEFTRQHEDWELDELIPLALASIFGLIAALIVRSGQLRAQISRRKRLEAEANALARHDALTGLPNRRFFSERAKAMVAEAVKSGGKVAMFAIDLDRFKPINDIYGHAAGDHVLQIVADRITAELPAGALASRMGGDEFAVFLEIDDDPHRVERIARRITGRIGEPMEIDSRSFSVTASIGIAIYPTDGNEVHQLHTRADIAMYAAKSAGRDSFAYFEPSLGEKHRKRYELERELAGAIAEGQIVPYLQPVFDLKSGAMKGFEILSRWNHPTRGVLLPEEFIPLAEDSGQIVKLSDCVLRQACEAVAGWVPPLSYSFNISPLQFREPRLVERIVEILEQTGMRSGSLEVEITETVFIDDAERAKSIINELRANGISVALDDFGKGYSSLSLLSQLDIDKLKIDSSFIAGCSLGGRNEKIVNSVIQLGLSLGLETTAEGVDSTEDASWLAERGCALAQGFHYSEPMPVLSALNFFERNAGKIAAGEPVAVETVSGSKT